MNIRSVLDYEKSDCEVLKSAFSAYNVDIDFKFIGSVETAYYKLENALKNNFKIVVMYGYPGIGKTYLLQYFYNQYKIEYNLFLYKEPFFDIDKTLKSLYSSFVQVDLEDLDFDDFIESVKEDLKEDIWIILDEAQMYDTKTLEWIRIISDNTKFHFILSVHKVDNEHILAKNQFQSRIYEVIEIEPLNLDELIRYVKYRLELVNKSDFLTIFSNSNYKLIYKYTNGIMRDINRLMYKLIEVIEVYEGDVVWFLFKKLKNKYIEIAAFDLKMDKKW